MSNKKYFFYYFIFSTGDRRSGILKFQSNNHSDIKPVLRNVELDSILKKNQDTEAKQVI